MPGILALLPWWLGTSLAAPPAPLALTPEETAQLAQREVVTRTVEDGGKTYNVLVADVDAPPEAILKAVLDFPGKARDLDGFTGVELYGQQGDRTGVRWQVTTVGVDLTFHTIYQLDASKGWVEYALDPSQSNDLAEATGSYRVYSADGQTRLEYRDRSVPAIRVPDWLRRRMQIGFLLSELEWIRARAEAP